MAYVIYLRKSRADLEAEAHGEGETLARHKRRLLELAEQQNLDIADTYPEIVSGDTIAARPVMQKLLAEVEQGLWEGVLVVEVERLARGDTIDQGLVAQAFKYSNTKIITPNKTYDPSNEFDEEYFEFGLFMSRREYKMINRRLQAGRLASAKEGKWLGGPSPLGYDPYKLPNEKGSSLRPNDDADLIRTIFNLYANDPQMGTRRLCNHLNALGYRSSTGKLFNVGIVKEILNNPIYAGYITHGRRGYKKVIKGGEITYTYPRIKEYDIFPGRHEPLISQEVWDAVQSKLKARSFHPVRKDKTLTNPLSGLIICGTCGHKMQARPQASGRYIYCHHYCGMVSSRLEEVEDALIGALDQWLKTYTVQAAQAQTTDSMQGDTIRQSLDRLKKEQAAVSGKLQRAFDLVEEGVYTPQMFKDRQSALSQQLEEIESSITQAESILAEMDARNQASQTLLPMVAHVIDAYIKTDNAQDRNDLLKSVLDRVEYTKTTSSISSAGSDLKLKLYPKLPQKTDI